MGVSINVPGHYVAITRTPRCPGMFTYIDSVGGQVKCGSIAELFMSNAGASSGYVVVCL